MKNMVSFLRLSCIALLLFLFSSFIIASCDHDHDHDHEISVRHSCVLCFSQSVMVSGVTGFSLFLFCFYVSLVWLFIDVLLKEIVRLLIRPRSPPLFLSL